MSDKNFDQQLKEILKKLYLSSMDGNYDVERLNQAIKEVTSLTRGIEREAATKAIRCEHLNQYVIDSLPPTINCTDCGAILSEWSTPTKDTK